MLTDEDILELFFGRSETAIYELDAKYGALCRSIAYNILGSHEDAEECVNDAYLSVWNSIPPARPEILRAYVARVVRNFSLSAWRKKSAAKRGGVSLALEELDESLPAPGTVETELGAKELAAIIGGFLDTLPAESRVIFMRRYYLGESCAEAARRTGLTEKNVSVKLCRIRARLKRYLIESGVII